MANRRSRPDTPGVGSLKGPAPALLSLVLDAMPDPIVVTDPGGTVVAWNRAAETQYGIGAAEAVGRPMEALIRSVPRRGAPSRRVDMPLVGTRAGSEIIVEVSASDALEPGADDKPPSIAARVEIRRAVTPAARFEDELDGSGLRVRDSAELARLRTELARAQKLEALGQVIGGIAHELNNPMAAILAFSQLIQGDARLPEEMRDDAALLHQEAERARRVAQALVDVVRPRPPERHPTSIRPLVESVLALQTYSIGGPGIEVDVRIPPDLPTVAIDRALMQQVLLNLTINAVKAIRESGRKGRIEIAAALVGSERDGAIRLTIADDGPGVGSEQRPTLFTPFHTTRGSDGATGLGLAVSAAIVAAHGGRLRHEPGPNGRGATFVVELPLIPSTEVAHPSPPPHAAVPDRPQPRPATGQGQRILVLDDEPAIGTFLGRVLRNAGYRPVVTASGREAVEAVKTGDVAAVLCDYRMAGMSGTDVYEAVVSLRPELARRFAFMSGDIVNPNLSRFADEHGIILLAKPFDIASVEEIVRELTGVVPGN